MYFTDQRTAKTGEAELYQQRRHRPPALSLLKVVDATASNVNNVIRPASPVAGNLLFFDRRPTPPTATSSGPDRRHRRPAPSLVKDINPGLGDGSNPADFTPLGSILIVFTADDGTSRPGGLAERRLRRGDHRSLKDILRRQASGSNPQQFHRPPAPRPSSRRPTAPRATSSGLDRRNARAGTVIVKDFTPNMPATGEQSSIRNLSAFWCIDPLVHLQLDAATGSRAVQSATARPPGRPC